MSETLRVEPCEWGGKSVDDPLCEEYEPLYLVRPARPPPDGIPRYSKRAVFGPAPLAECRDYVRQRTTRAAAGVPQRNERSA